ncbi:hypothetical protein A2791_03350 [Candidatus Saccharibacteria bacterium RIFCSPHIGHO2_01_FULL_46_30]|nr:MAG: hypothetical protein A2791_03350 [Candidatus Saccharibacteria bacterium RIFCSPHIGHO2_01_FULL_46_30]
MSNINTLRLRQANKSYDRFEGQDHGSRGRSKGLDPDRGLYNEDKLRLTKGFKIDDISAGFDDYNTIAVETTPIALEVDEQHTPNPYTSKEADKIFDQYYGGLLDIDDLPGELAGIEEEASGKLSHEERESRVYDTLYAQLDRNDGGVNDNSDLDEAYAVNEAYDALNDTFQGDYIERDGAHRIRHRNAKRTLARVSFAGSSSEE